MLCNGKGREGNGGKREGGRKGKEKMRWTGIGRERGNVMPWEREGDKLLPCDGERKFCCGNEEEKIMP